jgi:hypothetical protein
MKRVALAAAFVVIIATIGSITEYNGPPRAISPDVSVTIRGSSEWWQRPHLISHRTDTDGVYVLAPEMPVDDKFAAVRISASTAEQSSRNVDISPPSGFKDCLPTEAVRALVHGVRFSRLAFHPFLFPAGQGPGFHHTDSATGTIEIVLQDAHGIRPLIRQRAYNSDRIVELLAYVCADPGGHWVATTLRVPEGWRIVVFRR